MMDLPSCARASASGADDEVEMAEAAWYNPSIAWLRITGHRWAVDSNANDVRSVADQGAGRETAMFLEEVGRV